jgi:ATP-dependent Clp protease ATP-binding subunit ClpX
MGFASTSATRLTRRKEILTNASQKTFSNMADPELVGRLPVVATLDELSEEDLQRIIVEPKNALVKQFQKLFEYEKIHLTFTDDALRAVAKEAARRKTGARGLRSILEEVMLDIMYEIPSRTDLRECTVDEEAILGKKSPVLLSERRAS